MTGPDLGKIELLVLDVDGVLTNGRIALTSRGDEIKVFHVRDGSAIKYWKRAGRKVAFISGRSSPAVTRRARELDVDAVQLNAKSKLPAYEEVLKELKVGEDRTAVIGDDLTDLPLLGRCGFSAAVADAAEEVRSRVDYVTRAAGGAGAVREVVEMILKKAGLWDQILARYVGGKRSRKA
ncbi:MAG: KdsC family phosphatase [Planctomycetota bacterium]|jgi:3-deoxy-D-manno-octulosonate 8-phosphate phosphatase (KDO 8-P phosphatase)